MAESCYGPVCKKPRKCSIGLFEVDPLPSKQREVKVSLKSAFGDICRNRQFSMVPLKIRNCNASYSNKGFSFPNANCDTEMYEQLYRFTKIFEHGERILQSFLQEDLKPSGILDLNMRHVLCTLLNYTVNEECHSALERVRRDRLNKTELAIRLGHHLISKLSYSSEFKLDQMKHNMKKADTCDCGCGEKLTGSVADTSIGHPDCWHGNVDILVDDSVPVLVLDEFCNEGTGGQSLPEMEPKKRDLEETDVISQSVAQTIISSFFQKQQYPYLDNYLMPGICISSKFVAFHFYDCEHDMLLRSPAISLFTIQRKINMRAILAIWLVVNYKYLCSGLTQTMIDRGHQAHFFDHADDKLEIYKAHLKRKEVVDSDEWEPFFPEHLEWTFE